MKRKIILWIVGAVMVAVVALVGLHFWRARVIERSERAAYAKVQALLRDGRGGDALALIGAARRPASSLDWAAVELDAWVAARQLASLSAAFDREPNRVLRHEEASVLLARASMHARRSEVFDRIRNVWQGHETHPDLWLALDADQLMLAGKPVEAKKLLERQKFTGSAEATRLVRLSLLTAGKDLPRAWELLEEAARLDPRQPDVRSFRAQILEALGKTPAARVEYVAAHLADPHNPLLWDQLAEYYLRTGNPDLALQTWRDALAPPSVDYIGLKAAFWGRMYQPALPDKGPAIPAGELQPLVEWLQQQPADRYWDSNSFQQLPAARRYAQDRQEVFWLQLLDDLKARRDVAALQLLQFNRFRTTSFEPVLEIALNRIAHYRLRHLLNPSDAVYPAMGTNHHAFLVQLDDLARQERTTRQSAVPPELDAFLRGPNAYAAALLAAGWREAGLQCLDPAVVTGGGPEWFPYTVAQSLRYNRGNRAALDYLAKVKATPILEGLAGELLLGENRVKEGFERLAPLATQPTDAGQRAAWLLAIASTDMKRYDEARQWVNNQPQLARDPAGQEIMARVALLEGKTNEASGIYRLIATQSVEARSFLARAAFDRQDWAAARRFTQELLALMPDQMELRANLALINEAQSAK